MRDIKNSDNCAAARTRTLHVHGDRCVRVVPLHEGHGKGIDRSGREGVFTRIEMDSMPRVFACHRVRPGHGVGLCAIQERQIALQVFDQLRGGGQQERSKKRQEPDGPKQLKATDAACT